MKTKKLVLAITLAFVVTSGIVAAGPADDKRALDSAGSGVYTTIKADRNGGDDCAGAPTIAVASYSDSGDTTGYTDDWGPQVSGYGQDGEDQAYRIVITSAGNIDVTVTPAAGYDTATYLFAEADCANYTPTVLAGADIAFGGEPETLSYAAAPGTYIIVVDGYNPGIVGAFTIDVMSNVPVELTRMTVE